MNPKGYLRKLKRRAKLYSFLLHNPGKEKFVCPVCNYNGPFMDVNPPTGLRKHAKCPKCGASERHRIQYVVVNNLLNTIDTSSLRMLHFAPEPFFKAFFAERFDQYETADLSMENVDHTVDIQQLPFKDQTYDFIFASHVLEHIPDDTKAIAEIWRILKPNGIAILPVPLIAETTVEYPEPNPNEAYHVRAPGLDYFDRFRSVFMKIDLVDSNSLPSEYQPYIYEDRSHWPTVECPLRPSMKGEKHIDIVPICYS